MNHQEIEFTFEGDGRADLYLLQTRDDGAWPRARGRRLRAPATSSRPPGSPPGIGVGGGALSGRVAHTAPRRRASCAGVTPGTTSSCCGRDTVPDDIPLMLQVDGLLTSVGGATSHAAVAAKRLGKTCVVGTRAAPGHGAGGALARSATTTSRTGDLLSISGIDGASTSARTPSTELRVRGAPSSDDPRRTGGRHERPTSTREALGINGLGRIGKLTLWHHVARRHFPRLGGQPRS